MANEFTLFSDAFFLEAERHAAWGAAQLRALTSFLPEGSWAADLETCRYQQGGPQGEVELRVGLLGSFDTDELTWMWGWAHPGLQGTEVVALTGALARYGRVYGIPELTLPVLDLSGLADPRHAAELLAFVGMGVADAPGYIGVPAGPGSQVYFLPDDPRVPRPALDPITLPRHLIDGASLIGHAPREVVTGYFDHHGAPWETAADGRIVAELPDGSAAEVEFDELGRIAGVRATARP
ncbi:DUF6882 domain-containing protein [Streptomyces sp. NPDC004327]|uniref:DUF6882 domain-containing protein n=1 Tax=Streptomyces sp. NPDC004327 TaxID=3364699 RepID=UPI00369F596C